MVLCHADVCSTLLEVKGRLHQVPIVLDAQLSSAGGDGHCEGVDDKSLALPQVHLQVMSTSASSDLPGGCAIHAVYLQGMCATGFSDINISQEAETHVGGVGQQGFVMEGVPAQ